MTTETFGHLLTRIDRRGEPDLPLLGVSVATGVRLRGDDDGRPAPSLDLSGYKVVEPGDIIMNALGKPHGSIGRSEIRGITSPAYWVLKAQPTLDSRYAHHLLRSQWAVSRYAGLGKNLPPNQFDIPWETFAKIETWLPTVEEQRGIADFLDDRVARIDQIIAARQQQAACLDEGRSGLADGALIEEDWRRAARSSYAIRRIEQGWSPQCDSVPAADDEWGVLKVSAVRAGVFREAENKLLPQDLAPRPEYEIKAGDLLVTRANTPALVGAFAAVPHGVRPRLILCDKIMRIELEPRLSPDFASLVGQTRRVRDLLNGAGTGTSQSMVNVRGSDIRDLPMPQLSPSEQAKRVERWTRESAGLDAGILSLGKQVERWQEYKQSLITAAVTGEFDVTTAAPIPE